MKKVYALLTLVLMLMGIGTAKATVVMGGDALATVGDGDEFLFTGNLTRPGADATYLPIGESTTYYFCDPITGELASSSNADILTDNFVWVAELFETDADGNQWFHLKNKKTGKYMGREIPADMRPSNLVGDGNDGFFNDGSLQCGLSMIMTGEEGAAPFTFKNPVDGTAFINKPVATAELSASHSDPLLMAITYVDIEGTRYYMMPNYAYGTYYCSYADFACWLNVREAIVDPTSGAREEIAALIGTLTINHYTVGDWPGCLADMAAAQEYNEAYAAAYDAIDDFSLSEDEVEAAYDRLTAAIAAARACNEYLPMRAGIFRIVCAYTKFEEIQGVQKAVGVNGNGVVWGDLNPEAKSQVWIFTEAEEEGKFYMQNGETGAYLTGTPGQSAQYTTSAEPTNTVYFTHYERGVFTIRTTGASYDLHPAGHSSGNGTNGNIVGWNRGSAGAGTDGSQWYVMPVEDYIASDIVDAVRQKALDNKLASLLTSAKASYNSAVIQPTYDVIVNDASWISSPYSDPSEGAIANLIDNDRTTYWHSTWREGNQPMMFHYLQFDLQKPYNLVTMQYCRRNGAANDYPRSFVIYGVSDPDADNDLEASDSICRVEVPDITKLETQLTASFDLKAHRYIRLYVDSVGNGVDYQRGYWHAAELNFIDGAVETKEPTLPENLQAAGEALKAAIEAATLIEAGSTTQADIDALQAAYDAFIEAFPNPASLNSAIAAAKTAVSGAYVARDGEEDLPGVNTQGQLQALQDVLATAQAYVDQDRNAYTKEGLAEQCENVMAAVAAFKSGVVLPDTEHWYHISCPSVHNEKVGYLPNDNGLELTGTVITVDGDETAASGTQMHMVAPEELLNADNALWRFVAITDTSYAVQNKATGLFVNLNATTGARALSTIPGMFRFAPYGDRVFNLVGTNIAGTIESCMHMQKDNHILVAWPTRGDGGLNNGSSWQIDPVEPISDFENILNQSIVPERMYGMCYPFGVTAVESGNILTVSYIGEDGVGFAENENGVAPGEPFFYINENIKDTTVVGFTITEALTTEALTAVDGIVAGTLTGVAPGAGCGYVQDINAGDEGHVFKITLTGATTNIAAGVAYIDVEGKGGALPNGDYEWFLPYTGSPLSDAIQSVIAETVPVNGIYTISGQKLNVVAKPGLYIVNGKKVAIK